ILRTTVPKQFTDGQHPFDYCNTANYWLRTTESPYRARVLYLMANFVNDAARANKLVTSVLERDCASFDASGRTPAALLVELDEAILAYDIPRATALANAYLQSGADRGAYQAAVAVTACKSRTTRTTRRSRTRPSKNTARTPRTCATACCSPRSDCSPGGRRCPASASATPAS